MRRTLVVVLVLGFLSACGSSSPKRDEDGPLRKGTMLGQGQLEVLRVNDTGNGSSSKGCRLDVRRKSSRAQNVQYRILWFSKQGRQIVRGPNPWKKLSFNSRGEATLTSEAPAPWCDRYEVDIRNAN